MNKFKILISEYQSTQVLKGSKILYFMFYWKTKALSFLQQRSQLMNSVIHFFVRFLPKTTFVIQNMSGVFLVQAFDDSTTICSDYFEKELRGWLTTPTVKDIFVDIGANRGIYTIIAPTLFEYKAVHAFEPNPEVVEILKKNIELNNLSKQVTVHNYALGQQKGTVDFECDPMHKGGGRITDIKNKSQMTVSVETFDSLAVTIPLKRISFIKIDTEGFEFNVLAGMKKVLQEMGTGTCIMIESTEPEKVGEILTPYGFKLSASQNHDHLFIKNA